MFPFFYLSIRDSGKDFSFFSVFSLFTCSLSLFSQNFKWNTQVSSDAWKHFNLVEGHSIAKILLLKINLKEYSFRNSTAMVYTKLKSFQLLPIAFWGTVHERLMIWVCKKGDSHFLKKFTVRKLLDRKINAVWSEENLTDWQLFSWLITVRKVFFGGGGKVFCIIIELQNTRECEAKGISCLFS